MKRCPTCQRIYEDEALAFCPHDNTILTGDQVALAASATRIHKPNPDPADAKKLPPVADPSTLLFSSHRLVSQEATKSLAILPLENVGDDPSMEYLSDGITESLINNLSQLPHLRVMARSTVFRYKGMELNPQEVGRDLKVDAVLTGRVLNLDDRLVISTELVNTADGSLIWGERYDLKPTDIFAIQDEISREISDRLRIKLTSDEQERLAKRHTDNTEAYRLYLKGRYCWNKRTPEGFRKGIEYFKQAIDSDSGYALAYAGLADSYNMLGNYSVLPPHEAFPMAKTAAIKALRIDETLSEARTSLAYVKNSYDWDWEGAGIEFRRAIELKPSYATAHYWYALAHLAALGRLEEAMDEMVRARKLDPLSLIISTNLGWIYHFARQYDKAIEQLQKTLEMDANFNVAYYKLGQVYEQKGMYTEAIAEYNKARSLSPSHLAVIPALGHAYAKSGQFSEAYNLLAVLKGLSRQRYVSPYFIAEVYWGLGEVDKAFAWLEKAVEDRSDWLVWIGVEPGLDSLRSDPRFTDLLRRIKLAA